MTENRRSSAPWLALAVLALGLFMTLLDLTIVNVAIPSMVDDLHASLDQILWVLNGYSLAYAVLLITSGRLGDIFGPRNMFAAGIVVFTVASAFSGLAQDPTQLILARGLQGIGAAIIAPQGLPIMTTIFPPERRAGVFAIYGSLAGLAVLLGPVVGGFIVTNFGWRWIFYINRPIGLLTFLLAFAFVPDLRPGRRHRLDWTGVALATTGLLGIVFGLIEGQRYDWATVWSWITIPEIIAAGVAVLVLFFLVQWRRQDREPLLPFAIFKDRNYTLMTLVLMAMGFAIVGFFLPLTIFYQSVLGLSAFDAGLAIAPQPLAMMLMSAVAGAVLQHQRPADLHDRALSYSARLPSQAQAPFVDGFSQAARSGLQIGRGQTGTSLSLPANVPAQVAHQIQQLAHAVFTQAFVDAMRPTMALAIAVVVVAAVGALAAGNGAAGGRGRAGTEAQPEPASVA